MLVGGIKILSSIPSAPASAIFEANAGHSLGVTQLMLAITGILTAFFDSSISFR
jgi:hypothetical protein